MDGMVSSPSLVLLHLLAFHFSLVDYPLKTFGDTFKVLQGRIICLIALCKISYRRKHRSSLMFCSLQAHRDIQYAQTPLNYTRGASKDQESEQGCEQDEFPQKREVSHPRILPP